MLPAICLEWKDPKCVPIVNFSIYSHVNHTCAQRALPPLRNHRATIKHNIASPEPKPFASHHLDVTSKSHKPDSPATFKAQPRV